MAFVRCPWQTDPTHRVRQTSDIKLGESDGKRSRCKSQGRAWTYCRQLAEELAKPYERGKTEQWRKDIVEVQSTISAIDAAWKEEAAIAAGKGPIKDWDPNNPFGE